MRPVRSLSLIAIAVAALLALPAGAAAASFVPGEVIVKYRDGSSGSVRAKVEQSAGTDVERHLPGGSRELEIDDGESVGETLRELRSSPNVAYAVPNYIARASGFVPNDPSFPSQWNLQGAFGLNMPDAWALAQGLNIPGGRGVTVAVIDTGVAYATASRFELVRSYDRYRRWISFKRAPDLSPYRFARGYDFVGNDPYPHDLNGHGTHVAGTVAQSTHNGWRGAGVAYLAKIMPVRALDADGAGDAVSISRAIRYAARNGALVINLSVEFESSVQSWMIPDVISALRYARSRGVLVVGASGNGSRSAVAYPARHYYVTAVGATTIRGCQAEYSNDGVGIDLSAPGGGYDAYLPDNPADASRCQPYAQSADILQETFTSNLRTFGLARGYEGTSMAAPHVAGVAAMVISSRRIGRLPSPVAVEAHLKRTARDLGPAGPDNRYGGGLVDAAAALR